jgi:UDP-MurNAc hydroxylase
VKVTLLGHASVLVEMDGVTCLMDPVFRDPFEEGAVVSCPRREISVERLPRVDVLILSHGHLDHFDIPSLARLRRDVDVLCPKDHTILYALKELGFENVHDTEPNTVVQFPTYELMTTRSSVSNVIEFGVLFKDRSGSFWNQVDTVAMPETVEGVRARAGGTLDLMFAMHASQKFDFFQSRSTEFPYEMHQLNLSTVLAANPRMAVPGAAGFRFAGPIAWCNAFMFPMSREQFVQDLGALDPTLQTSIANPGDVYEIDHGSVRHLPAASTAARMIEDDTALIRFDPTAAVPPLVDTNPSQYAEHHVQATVDAALDAFKAYVRASYAAPDPVFAAYRKLRATYAVGVVYPDGTERTHRVKLGETEATFDAGTSGCVADAAQRVTASALTAWATREKTYFYLRAFSRKLSTLYALDRAADGKVTVSRQNVPDLFEHFMTRRAKGAELALKQRFDQELRPFKAKA